jgi:hypothetical protein
MMVSSWLLARLGSSIITEPFSGVWLLKRIDTCTHQLARAQTRGKEAVRLARV